MILQEVIRVTDRKRPKGDIVVDVEELSPEEVVEEILRKLA